MCYQDLIPDALDFVSILEVPDELFVHTVTDTAMMFSGMSSEEITESQPEIL